MKKLLILILLITVGLSSYAQQPDNTYKYFPNGFAVGNGSTNKPSTGTILAGSLWYKTGTGFQVYNGSAWVTLATSSSIPTNYWTTNSNQIGLTGDKTTTGSLTIAYDSDNYGLSVTSPGSTNPSLIVDNTAGSGIGSIQDWKHQSTTRASVSKAGLFLTSGGYAKVGGTSSQVLLADGTVGALTGGTVTSLTPGYGLTPQTAITSTGTFKVDTLVLDTVYAKIGDIPTISFGTFGSTPNAQGGSYSGGVITLQPASASFPGGVTTSDQTFAGNKTYNNKVTVKDTLFVDDTDAAIDMDAAEDVGIIMDKGGVGFDALVKYETLGNKNWEVGTRTGTRNFSIFNNKLNLDAIEIDTATNYVYIENSLEVPMTVQTGKTDTASNVLYDGDSLTYGVGTGTITAYPYLVTYNNYFQYSIIAVPGRTVYEERVAAPRRIDSLFRPGARENIIIVWLGTNDLYDTSDVNRTFNNLVAYCHARQSKGFKVLVLNTIARTGNSAGGVAMSTLIGQYNTLMANRWPTFADGYLDLFTSFPTPSGPNYDADGIHLTQTGYDLVASLVTAYLPSISVKNSTLNGTGIITQSGVTTNYVTTSNGISSMLSDETGTGSAVFGTSPTITTPTLAGRQSLSSAYFTADASNGFTINNPTDTDNLIFLHPTLGTWRWFKYGAGTLTTDASGNITATSDRNAKEKFVPFTKGLSAMESWKPQTYNWKAKTGLDTKERYTSLIAQDVRETVPEAIGKMANGDLTVQDRVVIATMVNAINELSTIIETEKKVSEIRFNLLLKQQAIIEKLNARITVLENK